MPRDPDSLGEKERQLPGVPQTRLRPALVPPLPSLGQFEIGSKGYADDIHKEGFASVRDLLQQYVAGGGTLIACAACCKPRGITADDLVEGAEIAGAAR